MFGSAMKPLALAVLLCLALAAPARAARVPTPDESAALIALLNGAVAQDGGCGGRFAPPVPLVSDDPTWGYVTGYCVITPGSGAGQRIWGIWAHRATADSTTWTIAYPTAASRVPPCSSRDGSIGLLDAVPEAVVRDLRGECAYPTYRPAPLLSLQIFRNVSHKFDLIGPSLQLSSLSEVNGGGDGFLSLDRDSGTTPGLAAVREQFGKPSTVKRSALGTCTARWGKVGLIATAHGGATCAAAGTRVSALELTGPWELAHPESDDEDFADSAAQPARVGDAIALAGYLDPRLKRLPADGRLRIARYRIASTTATVTAVTRQGRLRALAITLR
jgi:hypothetical protein